jgi:dipeptidyl aminopeptidase/acylaminoacyl peptidase
MIWSGEQSGYRHLYKITKLSQSTRLERLTSGDWSVLDHQIFIDKIRGLVYFLGNRDNSIESHLYVTTLNGNSDQILRLTTLGNSYKIQLNIAKGAGVMMFSNLSTPVKTQLFQLQFKDQNAIFPILAPLSEFASSPVPMKSFLPKVEHFQFSNTVGITLNGLIFKPSQLELSENLRLDYQFSTLLYVYGGPKSQLVTNEFQYQKLIRCYLACQLGYIVVVIDGRGTANRGLEFESKIYGELGDCELEDQVEGLNHLINKTPIGKFMNRQRIAITGWSYGGYLSLMAMVKYSDIFKLCISGAPVIDWEYYDNAYTERYLGFPDKNPQGYKKSSILNYVESFPNEENRVLICHGMMDNNVHFSHTEKLINSLIKYNKPYQLQIFPNERHGLKEPNSLDHFDTLMFYWLKNYL